MLIILDCFVFFFIIFGGIDFNEYCKNKDKLEIMRKVLEKVR